MTRTTLLSAPLLFLLAVSVWGQARLTYRVEYSNAASPSVHIAIIPAKPVKGPMIMVFPRAIPSGYSQVFYDRYVEDVKAVSSSGVSLKIERQQGSRWLVGSASSDVARVEYDLNAVKMEREIMDASESSKVRSGYVGLLGYSVFGYLEGMEDAPIRMEISAPDGWLVYSTLAPKAPADKGKTNANAANFYELADSQIALGLKIEVRRLNAKIPLFLLTYAEVESDSERFGEIAADTFNKVINYFGDAPFTNYTVYIEILEPISERHEYGFSMEHLNSSTYFFGKDRAIKSNPATDVIERERFNFAHHFSHSWIPKKVYGAGYLPFNWELAPEIETIWFNEGFGRYAAIDALADAMPAKEAEIYRRQRLDRLRVILDEMPGFIRSMPLPKLSRVGSLMYGSDFRVGQTLFSKGALMAAEMDDLIQRRTGGRKRLRDSLRDLVKWGEKSGRAFEIAEFPELIAKPVGVSAREIREILNRWLEAK